MIKKDRNLFNRNFAILKAKAPALSQKLGNLAVAEGFWVEEARSGAPTLIYRSDGQETFLHSRYDPEKEAWRWAEGLGDEWEMLVLFGLGLGYHLLAVSRLYPGKRVILVVNDERHLLPPLYYLNLASLAQINLTLVVNADAAAAAQQVSHIVFNNLGYSQQIKVLPAYQSLYPAYWAAFQDEFSDQLLSYKSGLVTIGAHRMRWWKNYSENFLEYLEAPGVNSLFDKFAGFPVILVAAGPSLAKNIHLLPALQDKALILAAGSAIGPLLHYGFSPHLLLSCDPTENNYNHFAGLDGREIPFIFASSLYHKIVREYQGLKFSFALDTMNSWPDKVAGREKGVLRSGATVAVSCFDLAVKLGGDPIIFIGQDLAYTGMKTHAEGNFYARAVVDGEENGLFQTEGNNGPVYTTKALWTMKLHLERLISAARQERRIINATEGGAILRGTEIMPLAEAAERYCRLPRAVKDTILAAGQQRSSLSEDEAGRLAAALARLRRQAQLCAGCLAQAKETAGQLQHGEGKTAVTAEQLAGAEKKFKRLEKRILETELYQQFLRLMMFDLLTVTAMTASKKIADSENIPDKAVQVANGFVTWFRTVAEAAEYLEQEVIQPVEARLRG